MIIKRPMDSAAAVAAKAYADFALTAAFRSAHAYERYLQVVGCLARGQVSVEDVSRCMEQVAAARRTDLSSSVTALLGAFFTSLVGQHYLPTNRELGAPSDAADAASWSASLLNRAAARDAAAVGDFFARLGDVATGDRSAKEVLRDAKAFYRSAPADRLAAAAKAWFEFLSDLETLRADVGEESLKTVLERVIPGPAGDGVLELDAPAGQTASGEIVLENEHAETAAVRCDVSEFRRADGIGAAFCAALRVTPADFTVAEGGSSAVRLAVHLDANVYEPDTPYVGFLRIIRNQQARTDVPVRITASGTAA